MGMAVMGEIQVLQKDIGKVSDPDIIKAKGEGVCHTRFPGCRRRSMKKQLEGRMRMTLSKVCKHFNMAGEESANLDVMTQAWEESWSWPWKPRGGAEAWEQRGLCADQVCTLERLHCYRVDK